MPFPAPGDDGLSRPGIAPPRPSRPSRHAHAPLALSSAPAPLSYYPHTYAYVRPYPRVRLRARRGGKQTCPISICVVVVVVVVVVYYTPSFSITPNIFYSHSSYFRNASISCICVYLYYNFFF